MGKRKSAKKPQAKRKNEKLPTTFHCFFCNHDNSVTVKLNRKDMTGDLVCKNCDQRYQARIDSLPLFNTKTVTGTNIVGLSVEIDVWYQWDDACNHVAQEAAASRLETRPATAYTPTTIGRNKTSTALDDGEREDVGPDRYEDDGFIERDDEDAEADYA